jgi:hypothetical protein
MKWLHVVMCLFCFVQKWYANILDLLKGMVDFSLFLEWHFLVMSVATIVLFSWFSVTKTYLAGLMSWSRYTWEVSTFHNVISFTTFLGMVRSYLQAVTPSLSLHCDQCMKVLKGVPTSVVPSAFWRTSTIPKPLPLTKIITTDHIVS